MTDEQNPDSEGSGDPLERMAVHRYAKKLRKVSWDDVELLKANTATREIAGQLYESVGSIAANLAEGYSKSSGPDRARSFEYALGSARESTEWYESAIPVIGDETVAARLTILGHIQRLLVAIIPLERKRRIRPKKKRKPRKRPLKE
jgi:four helix bundle protein